MTLQPLLWSDFAPDLDSITSGACTDMSNVYPTQSGFYRTMPGLQLVGTGLSGTVLGGYSGLLIDQQLVAAATQNQLWIWNSGIFLSSNAALTLNQNRRRFAVYGNLIIVVDGVNVPYYYSSTFANPAFIPLPGWPGNFIGEPSIVETTDYATILVQANSQVLWSSLVPQGPYIPSVPAQVYQYNLGNIVGDITAAHRLRNLLVVYRQNAFQCATFVGVDIGWDFGSPGTISEDIGAAGNECVINTGDYHYIWGPDDFWQFDGYNLNRIPNNLKQFIFRDLDQGFFANVAGRYDINRTLVFWHYPSIKAKPRGSLDSYVSLNLRTGKWGFGRLNIDLPLTGLMPNPVDQQHTPDTGVFLTDHNLYLYDENAPFSVPATGGGGPTITGPNYVSDNNGTDSILFSQDLKTYTPQTALTALETAAGISSGTVVDVYYDGNVIIATYGSGGFNASNQYYLATWDVTNGWRLPLVVTDASLNTYLGGVNQSTQPFTGTQGIGFDGTTYAVAALLPFPPTGSGFEAVYTSTDRITWTAHAVDAIIANNTPSTLKWIPRLNLWVIAGEVIATSPTGAATWTTRLGTANLLIKQLFDDGTTLWAIGGTGGPTNIYSSTDAITWTQHSAPAPFPWQDTGATRGDIFFDSTLNLWVGATQNSTAQNFGLLWATSPLGPWTYGYTSPNNPPTYPAALFDYFARVGLRIYAYGHYDTDPTFTIGTITGNGTTATMTLPGNATVLPISLLVGITGNTDGAFNGVQSLTAGGTTSVTFASAHVGTGTGGTFTPVQQVPLLAWSIDGKTWTIEMPATPSPYQPPLFQDSTLSNGITAAPDGASLGGSLQIAGVNPIVSQNVLSTDGGETITTEFPTGQWVHIVTAPGVGPSGGGANLPNIATYIVSNDFGDRQMVYSTRRIRPGFALYPTVPNTTPTPVLITPLIQMTNTGTPPVPTPATGVPIAPSGFGDLKVTGRLTRFRLDLYGTCELAAGNVDINPTGSI